MSGNITPFLWFDAHAEEAMMFYTSIFADSRIVAIKRYPEGQQVGPTEGMEGLVLTGVFELAGQRFLALDGGPHLKFSPATSFFVTCESEDEIDGIWEKLSDGGSILMPLQAYPFSQKFGWLQDKYGLSWQLNLGAHAQKITPFLMFVGEQHGNAKEAIGFYTSLFRDTAVMNMELYGVDENGEVGTVKRGVFQLSNLKFMARDSNLEHDFTFEGAVSFYVECDTQEEIDYLWNKLSAVPEAEQCGWLQDKYGITWQIVPSVLPELVDGPDPEKAGRATQAMLQMKKLDIAALQRAYEGQ